MATHRTIIVDPSISKRSTRIPEERWIRHRDVIKKLWLVEGRPLQEVIRIMSQKYDFIARRVSTSLASTFEKNTAIFVSLLKCRPLILFVASLNIALSSECGSSRKICEA
jgi:hypothetical protein